MRFKDFLLTEMPHFVVDDIKINCPEGDVVKGGDVKYVFDYGLEHVDKSEMRRTMRVLNPIKKANDDVIPMWCRKHNIVFMWDSKTGKTFAPRDKKEKNFAKNVIKGIKSGVNKNILKNPPVIYK